MTKAKLFKAAKYALLTGCALLLLYGCVFAVYHLVIKNRSNIDLSEYGYVCDYLHNTYGGSYTLDRGWYECYDYGATGGMRQYYFYVSDTDGKQYVAHYCRFAQLSPETVSSITFA